MDKREIEKIAEKYISEKAFPGCVIGIYSEKEGRHVFPFGFHTFDRKKSMLEESVFDVASVTKSIPTSNLLQKAVSDGQVELDTKVKELLPEFNTSYKDEITLWHLLTYTLDYSGLRMSEIKERSPQEILDTILNYQFPSTPGETYAYVNATAVLMSLVLEKNYSKPLPQVADEIFFQPLGMKDTTFFPDKLELNRIVPSEICNWRGKEICGEVHDESTWTIQKERHVGAAGLFSTVPDLLIYMEMLLTNHNRYFSDELFQKMYTNQLEGIGESAGLGWELNQPRFMGKNCTKHTFGKTGFTGCLVVGDPVKKVGIVIFSNYTYPKRKKDRDQINGFRSEMCDVVWDNF